jgi:hypothetical protein
VWSVSSSNHCTLRERALHTHWVWGCVGSTVCLNGVVKGYPTAAAAARNWMTVIQPTAGHTTDWVNIIRQ